MVYEYFNTGCDDFELPNYDEEIKKECNGKIITNNAYTNAREHYWNNIFQEKYNSNISEGHKTCLINIVKENNEKTTTELESLRNNNEELHQKINRNVELLFKNKKSLESGEDTELIRKYRLENSDARTLRNKVIYIILIVLVLVFLIIEFSLLFL